MLFISSIFIICTIIRSIYGQSCESKDEKFEYNPATKIISWSPRIFHFTNFLSKSEIDYLIELSESFFKASQAFGTKQSRRSQTFWMNRSHEIFDENIKTIVTRIHEKAMIPIEHGEPLQLTKYLDGDLYEFHHDTDRRMARLATFIVYIHSPTEGGSTIFPFVKGKNTTGTNLPTPLNPYNLDEGVKPISDYCLTDQYYKVEPSLGDAILFFNFNPSLHIDEAAWHGSCPVVSGKKIILQRWIKIIPDPNYYA